MDLLTATAVFLLLIGIGFVEVHRSSDCEAVSNRLQAVTHSTGSADEHLLLPEHRSRVAGKLFGNLPRLDLLRHLQQNMWQAGMYAGVSTILFIISGLFVTGVGVAMLTSDDVVLALGAGAGLAMLPLLYIRMRRQRRMKAFVAQFPYALDLIKSSLEAGHTLQRGLQVVEKEFADPLGGEFRAVVEQSRLGMPLPEALGEMLRRVPEDDLRLLVVAVKVQTEVGSSLAQIVGRLSDIVRTRQRLYSQIRALTAQSRMSGMVVGLLPVIVLGMFSLIQPTYAHMLFFDHTGKMILKIAMGLDLGAFLTIRRILRVNF